MFSSRDNIVRSLLNASVTRLGVELLSSQARLTRQPVASCLHSPVRFITGFVK